MLLCMAAAFFMALASAGFFQWGHPRDRPRTGDRYTLIRPIYLAGVYDSLNDRRVIRDTARAYLEPVRYYKTSWIAFQCEVPAGTTVTIVSSAPKIWHLPFQADRYFVRLEPDCSRGLDVVLELNRGIEGDVDGLNPEIFERE